MRQEQRLERELIEVKERLATLERHFRGGFGDREPRPTAGPSSGWEGTIRYHGEATRPDGEIRWDQTRTVTDLLDCDPAQVAATLAALASPVRHAIVRALLDEPRSTRQLQAALELSSQGHIHYHLKELIAAGVVRPHGRGRYTLNPNAIIPYLALLSACGDLHDDAAAGRD